MSTKLDIKSVLDFSAFLPEPDDASAPWKKRFPGKKSLLIGISKNALTWKCLGKTGKVESSDIMRGDPKEALAQSGSHLKDLAEGGWCMVSLNTRYVISLETNLSRRPGSEEILNSNPRAVLGARYEKGKIYALTHNPETNSSVLLSCDEEQIRRLETMFREAGLRVGRIACGTYVLLKHALTQLNTMRGSEQPVSSFFVSCCEGTVCALVQDQDRWLELRSRTDVYEGDFSPITDLIAPFQSRLAPPIGITFISDEPLEGFKDQLAAAMPNREINDLSQPGLLASLLYQN